MKNPVVMEGLEHVAIPTWTVFAAGVDPGAFRTWCALAVYTANGAFPGVDTIAAELGIHRTTVFRQLDELEARGLVRRHRQHKANGAPVTTYELARAEPLAEAS
jgi:DNA-binding transcriptional MocR family regulator